MNRIIVYPAPSSNQILWVLTIVIASCCIWALYEDLNLANARAKRFEEMVKKEQSLNYSLRHEMKK